MQRHYLIAAAFLAAILTCSVGLATLEKSQAKDEAAQRLPPQRVPVQHQRGRKPAPPAVRKALYQQNKARHGNVVKSLPRASQPTFDCRTAFGNVLPTDDQGQCGDCFGVSAADGCSMALIKAGVLPLDASKGRLSSQYGLDNPQAFDGGCDGGNESQVIDFIHKTGFPLTSDYGPYQASPGRLKPLAGMKIYTIDDWGYCTPSQQESVAKTQDIKDAMAKYGPISVAFDASGCDNYRWPNVMKGNGNSVDHAVLCIGWDDSKHAFLGMNQWGDSWGGPNGSFWIDYDSYSWGTDAIWMLVNGVGPTPVPPGPTPVPPIDPTGAGTWLMLVFSVLVILIGVGMWLWNKFKPVLPVMPPGPSHPSVTSPTRFNIKAGAKTTSIDWTGLLAWIEAVIQQYGTTIIPALQVWVNALPVGPLIKTALLALIDLLAKEIGG